MAIPEFFQSLTERLHSSADVQKAYGAPISAEGKTIIPVAKIGYGFGGGSGFASKRLTDSIHPAGEGGGGGGGIAVMPVGVFEVSATGTRFISLTDKRKSLIAAAAGLALGVILFRRRNRK